MIPPRVVFKMEKIYEDMLDRAYKNIPELVDSHERFQVPRPDIRFAGRRTVVVNFREIADELRRDPEHLLKFLVSETATRANLDGNRAIFQGRFGFETIKNLLNIYVNKYVTCPVCGRPDTRIEKERRLFFLQCEACGARSSIGSG
jgi:translation initiation factor 2 subunit 2